MTGATNPAAMAPQLATTESVHLLTLVGFTAADIAVASRSLVFEQLLQRSYGDVRRYRSDYFHDARWLWEHLNTVPFSFVYKWSESGTWIAALGTTSSLIRREPGRPGRGVHPSYRRQPRAPRHRLSR